MNGQTVLRTRPQYYFDADKSYLIAGGLGGLGRSTGTWLADRGAKNIILVSRSGPASKTSVAFIKQLEERGVRVHATACDITNFADLSATLSKLAESMPPVRGVIQAAMVLQVSPRSDCSRVILLMHLKGRNNRKSDNRVLAHSYRAQGYGYLQSPSYLSSLRLLHRPGFNRRYHRFRRPGKLRRWKYLYGCPLPSSCRQRPKVDQLGSRVDDRRGRRGRE